MVRTAKEPGALRAAVQDAPRYRPIPSSRTICTKPRDRNASGLVLRNRQIVSLSAIGVGPFSPRDVLPLDLEDVEREEDDLSDSSQTRAPGKDQPESMQSELDKGRAGTHDPAVADIMALPFFSPKVLVKVDLKFLPRKSLKYGCPPNWRSRRFREVSVPDHTCARRTH